MKKLLVIIAVFATSPGWTLASRFAPKSNILDSTSYHWWRNRLRII